MSKQIPAVLCLCSSFLLFLCCNLQAAAHKIPQKTPPADQKTPVLHTLAMTGNVAQFEKIVRYPDTSNVNCRNDDGLTPLHCAVIHKKKNMVDALLNRRAAVNAQTKELMTPLHYAAQQGAVLIARDLIKHLANVNAQDNRLRTPLHYAAYLGSANMITLLLKHGADVRKQDSQGKLPLDLLDGKKQRAAKKILEKGFSSQVLQSYPNEYKSCKRLGIFLHHAPQSPHDATIVQLSNYIQQKAGPALVTSPLLHWYCLAHEESEYSAPAFQQRSSDYSLIDGEKEEALYANWDIFADNKKDPLFYLLIPHYEGKKNHGTFYGFKDSVLNQEILKLNFSRQSISQDDVAVFFNRWVPFIEAQGLTWNIYLTGYGAPGSAIAGLTIPQFKDFLHFLSQSIKTHALVYQSSYSNGINQQLAFLSEYNEPLRFNFFIGQVSFASVRLRTKGESSYRIQSNFSYLFNSLQAIFQNREHFSPTRYCFWSGVTASLINYELPELALHGCFMRPAGYDKFIPHVTGENCALIDETSFLPYATQYKTVTKSNKEVSTVLLNTSYVPSHLWLPKNIKKIISINHEESFHIIDGIASKNGSLFNFFTLFDLGSTFVGNKIFVIQELESKADHLVINLQGDAETVRATFLFKAKQSAEQESMKIAAGKWYQYSKTYTPPPLLVTSNAISDPNALHTYDQKCRQKLKEITPCDLFYKTEKFFIKLEREKAHSPFPCRHSNDSNALILTVREHLKAVCLTP